MGDYIAQQNLQFQLEQIASNLWWELLGLVLTVFALTLLKNVLQQFIDGIFWRLGTELKKHDIILFDGEYGRIVKLGWVKTDFYLYKSFFKARGKHVPSGATTFTYINAKLSDHRIERFIELVNIDDFGIDQKDTQHKK